MNSTKSNCNQKRKIEEGILTIVDNHVETLYNLSLDSILQKQEENTTLTEQNIYLRIVYPYDRRTIFEHQYTKTILVVAEPTTVLSNEHCHYSISDNTKIQQDNLFLSKLMIITHPMNISFITLPI